MREIKFRGLRTDGKGWVYGSLVNNLWVYSENSKYHKQPVCDIIVDGECNDFEEMESNEQNISVIPESVGQFTGLLDSKNNDIYEGDLLQDFRKKIIYECVFRENGAFEFQNKTTLNFALLHELWDNEIIGNIHTTPELLNN